MDPNQSLMDQYRSGNLGAFGNNERHNTTQQYDHGNYGGDLGYNGGQNQHDYTQYAPMAGAVASTGYNYAKDNFTQEDYVNAGKFAMSHANEASYYADKFGDNIMNTSQQPPYMGGTDYGTGTVSQVQPQVYPGYGGGGAGPASGSMMKSKSEMQLPGMHSAASGIASSYKDLLGLRRHEPPELEVGEAVIKSTATGKHHVYKVKGRDHQGEVEVLRRFREFDTLRKTFYSRFLGLYVPPIPEKKAMGKTEGLFVEERQFFLDRFLKEVAQLPYLYESEEFQVFLRPQPPNVNDVERALETLPRLTTDDLLTRFRTVMPVNEMAGDLKLKAYNEQINDFVRDCRDYIEHLKGFKKHIKVIVPLKEQEVNYYKEFVDFLVKYEDTNTKKAKMGDATVNLLTGDARIDLKQQLQSTAESIKNPFKHIRNWIKGEIMELNALLECISRKEGVEAAKSKAITKVKDNKDTVDKMNTGKFTFKGLFKSQSGKATETQNILSNISQTEKDIANYEIIKNFLIIYLAEIAIPAFKNQKVHNYVLAMARFSNQEISNSRVQSECWSSFLTQVRVSAAKQHINIK